MQCCNIAFVAQRLRGRTLTSCGTSTITNTRRRLVVLCAPCPRCLVVWIAWP
jgi:hypothetical protein